MSEKKKDNNRKMKMKDAKCIQKKQKTKATE